jgi:hypothetical protein
MSRPSHYSRFDHSNNSWWGVEVIQFLIRLFSSLPCYLVPQLFYTMRKMGL